MPLNMIPRTPQPNPLRRPAARAVVAVGLALLPQLAVAQAPADLAAPDPRLAGVQAEDADGLNSAVGIEATRTDSAYLAYAGNLDLTRIAAGAAPRADSGSLDRATIKRVADRTVAMTLRQGDAINLWDWEGGVAVAGLMYAYEATGDPAILREVQRWTDARLAEGVTISHPNHTTPAWGVLMLYGHVPDPRYRAIVERSVDFLMHHASRVHGTLSHVDDQLWDDTLIVSVPLLARYGAEYSCRECLDLALDEYLAHARRLQDPRTGCWYHGWDASAARDGEFPHMSGAFWARGNSWAALAATELLHFLPEDHPQRQEVITVLDHQLRGLLTWRDRSKLWHTVVTRPDFYLEASGSAGIAAAMLRASQAGWVDPGFWPVGLETREAVRARVAADGMLTQVSSGTGVAPSIDIYNRIPTDQIKPYGQGLYLIMATAGEVP